MTLRFKIPPEFWLALGLTLLVLALATSCCPKVTSSQMLIRGDSTVVFTPGEVTTPADTATGWFNAVEFCDSLVRWRRDTVFIPVRTTSGRAATGRITVGTAGVATLAIELDSLKQTIDSLNRSVTRVDTLRVDTVVEKCRSGWHKFTGWWFIGSIIAIFALLVLKFR